VQAIDVYTSEVLFYLENLKQQQHNNTIILCIINVRTSSVSKLASS